MVNWFVLFALAIIVANMGILMITNSLFVGRVLAVISIICLVFIVCVCVSDVLGVIL